MEVNIKGKAAFNTMARKSRVEFKFEAIFQVTFWAFYVGHIEIPKSYLDQL